MLVTLTKKIISTYMHIFCRDKVTKIHLNAEKVDMFVPQLGRQLHYRITNRKRLPPHKHSDKDKGEEESSDLQ